MSSIIFGLWPLAGMTTLGVTARDRDETMTAAIDAGITHFDTAFSYGLDGTSDDLIRRYVVPHRDLMTVTGKVGQRYENGARVVRCDGKTLKRDATECRRRTGLDCFDTLLLHDIDPNVPIERSAEAMASLIDCGITKRLGVCNATIDQIDRFASVAPLSATQCKLNILQPEALQSFIPACNDRHIEVDNCSCSTASAACPRAQAVFLAISG